MAALTILVLTSCGPAPVPTEEIPPPTAPAADEAPAAFMKQWGKRRSQVRKWLDRQRSEQQAAFEEDYAFYQQVLKNYSTPAARLAAWSWITKTWRVQNAGDRPGELTWDDRTAFVTLRGTEPREIKIALGSGVEFELVWIDPGLFWMGSEEAEPSRGNDEHRHQAFITRGFWMGKHEVTQALWQFVMATNSAGIKAPGSGEPIEQVSWYDAQLFVVELNALVARRPDFWIGTSFRLPSEAEWEYACRAGTTTPVYAADKTPLDAICWYGGNSSGTHPVGRRRPNAWGLQDMIGNVSEWCVDAYGPYPLDPAMDPTGPDSGSNRVARGACWESPAADCRAAHREAVPPVTRSNRTGFRLAASS